MQENLARKKRKHKLHLRVPVDHEDEKIIKSRANDCGLSISEYLRKLGINYEPASIIDNEKVNEMAKINGDLGRLGGLLKLWLSDDRRVANFDKRAINKLLNDIELTRSKMAGTMMQVIKSKK